MTDVILKMLANVKEERVGWLSPGRLAEGMISVMDGDPGDGKSTLTIEWAARVTRGEALPDGIAREPRGVVIISPEDSISTTIMPRFKAAGADLTRVVSLEGSADPVDPDVVHPPVIPRDLDLIRKAVETVDAALLIIDPLFAVLDPEISSKSDQDVRRALTPLARLADETRVAVLIVRHLNKATGGSAIYRGGGSIGIIGVARMGMLVGRDPDDPEIRVLASTKVNVGRMPPSIRFQMVSSPTNSDVATIGYLGESQHRAGDLLSAPNEKDREEEASGAFEEAVAWLRSYLAGGSIPANEVQNAAGKDGISKRTLMRAKAAIGVQSSRYGGVGGKGAWHWSLPMSHDDDAKDASENAKDAKSANQDERGTMAHLDSAVSNGHRSPPDSEVEELASELVRGGLPAIDDLRSDLSSNKKISDDDRRAAFMAIQIAELQIQGAA